MPKEHIIGATFPYSNDAKRLFQSANLSNAKAIQFFFPSNTWPAIHVTDGEAAVFHEARNDFLGDKESVFLHGHLHLNLASANKGTFDRCLRLFKSEVAACQKLGVKFYVLHPGSPKKQMSHQDAITQIALSIDSALEHNPNVTILVENMAGQGDTIGATLEELAAIILACTHKNRVGVCLDTQHLWAAGNNLTKWPLLAEKFENLIGWNRLKLIHFNDSECPLGSHMDRHARIGQGQIPIDTLRAIVSNEQCRGIPFILLRFKLFESKIEGFYWARVDELQPNKTKRNVGVSALSGGVVHRRVPTSNNSCS
jgi:apurinic endonuclease APN1